MMNDAFHACRRRWRRRVAAIGLLVTAIVHPAAAQTPPASADRPAAAVALEALLAERSLAPERFAPVLLDEIALERLQRIRDDLLAAHGALLGIERDGARWILRLERARVPTRVALDPQGRIRSLFFERAIPVPDGLAAGLAGLAGLPGRAAFVVRDGGRERAARQPDLALGVGSAFKMLVLREYAADLAAGLRRAEDVVTLRPEWKAPGSGMIGGWPDFTPIALGTLATMMIAISDNTATDALMHVIGRARLDAAAPAASRPLMSTRELHLLRVHRDAATLASWRTGDLDARRAVLAALPPGRDLPETWGATLAHDIDYAFSARELCALIAAVADRPEMRVNPGPAAALGWSWAAYKGGSTDTSISSTVLAGLGERRVCVAAIWNHAPRVERERFLAAVRGVLAVLAAEGPRADAR